MLSAVGSASALAPSAAGPPHLDRRARPQAAHRPLEICHPWRDTGRCCREGSLRHPGRRKRIIASSTRPDQPRWIRAGGPSQTVAVICRHTVWTRPPEPDDLENEGLWCQPFWERRPDVRFCGHQRPQSTMGSSHGFDNGRARRKMTILMVPRSLRREDAPQWRAPSDPLSRFSLSTPLVAV